MSKPTFNRRAFLAGTGAGLLLPRLEYFFCSDSVFAQEMTKPCFMSVFLANGVISSEWECTGTETNWQLGSGMAGLAANKDNLTVIQGIENSAGKESELLNTDANHWVAATSFLTGCHYDFNADPVNNLKLSQNFASIDQRIAASDNSPVKSLVMGLQDVTYAPDGDARGNAYYLSKTSWLNQTTQASRLASSSAVFHAIFGANAVPGQGAPPPPPPSFNPLPSVLDAVLAQRDRFVTKLGSADKMRMEKYFDAIREVELSIAAEQQLAQLSCDVPAGDFETSTAISLINQRAANMARLAAIALGCGVTRVVSHMLANEHNYGPSDLMAGVTDNGTVVQHHSASHYSFEGSLPMARAYVTWQVKLFNDIVNELKAAGVLDNAIVYFGSGMGDSQAHSFSDLPIVIAGKGAGKLHPGRLLNKADKQADILLTLLNLAGVSAASQGSSTKVVDYL